MHPMIEERLPDVRDICRRHHVTHLELFGSAATTDFDPAHSDLDFLVEFSSEADAPWMGDYFDLKQDLEALFGRRVDLVMPGAVRNPYFRRNISAHRTVLYAE